MLRLFVLLDTNCKIAHVVSPTPTVTLALFVIPCKFFRTLQITMLQILSLAMQLFFIQKSIIHDNISSHEC